MAKKKQTREELAFPVAMIPKLGHQSKPIENPEVIKLIIRGAIKGAYQLKTPSEPGSYSSDYGSPKHVVILSFCYNHR